LLMTTAAMDALKANASLMAAHTNETKA
jgi:hypothetical protein